ncbi:MBL fold metallo-hydrolase [Virgisporangium aliadipatigenens]|uniref:MBL fold metallo-hydrolase n=1 Tax=Virgisporangium aliadipatigenens TaxID=741659 RepID=A0A8J3YU24_9ACTN|nr:MBL fold metallo-hydrolase [Virgisporangium aliadipatigenens]GIJ50657.1 MBL fold metallo-hydrolase [Virgisporangium aliadipatigenens]
MSTSHDDREPLAPPKVEDLGGGLYAYIQPNGTWFINNTGFLVSRTGVISVDACSTTRRTIAYREAIGRVTPQPIRTLVNTHSHPDHTVGNNQFGTATIVGHEQTRRETLVPFPMAPGIFEPFDMGDTTPAPPFLTYTDGVTLWSDDLRVEVKYVGTPAHTTNDSIIWVPERGVLYAGDLLFNGGTPFLVSGSLSGAIEVLETVIAPLGATTIVPGHGELTGPDLIEPTLAYLRFVQETAKGAHAAGLTPLEAARETDLGDYAGWHDSERIVGNLHRAYAEIDGKPRGVPLDILAVLTDMVTYNGGRPLTCRA